MNALLNQPWVARLGWALVHSLWQGLAVAILLAIVLRLMRRAPSQARYLVACGAMVGALMLPVMTFVSMSWDETSVVESAAAQDSVEARAAELAAAHPPASASASVQRSSRDGNAIESIMPHIALAWLVTVQVLAVWHAGGWWHLHRLCRRMARPAPPAQVAMLSRLLAQLKISRPVTLVESALADVPMVMGHLRPIVLLPASAITGLTPVQLESLLAHELAHIRRHDYLVNLLQTFIEIVMFYHPAVWWIGRQMRQEREYCCDDIAARVCGDHVQYARALATMEELRSGLAQPALAASGGVLLPRIRRVLGIEETTPPMRRSIIAIGAVMALLLGVLGIQLSGSVKTAPTTQNAAAPEKHQPDRVPSGRPAVVESSPSDGQMEVDPNLKELRVKFNRPMKTDGGWSFVGGGPGFPKITGKPTWADDRTIVLPIELQPSHGYWTSINYGNFNNFRDKTGAPVKPHPISFATGPGKLAKPKVEKTIPASGEAVDPATQEIRVTFDQPMDRENGWTFTQQSPETFPEVLNRPTWVDERTIALPVKLQAGKPYWISINTPEIQNFKGANHLAAEPYVLEFKTKDR